MNATRTYSPAKAAKIRAVFDRIGTIGEFDRIARRMLRDTPEYEQARKEGRARDWLASEADSMAQMLYEAAQNRLQDLDP